MRTEIFREALAAHVKYETQLGQEDLEKRNVKSFSVSAETHMERAEVEDFDTALVMSIDTRGIVAPGRFLYELPASSNYRRYTNHVFNILPRLEDLAGLVFEVHVEDNGYATMRHDLQQKIPILKKNLEDLITTQLSSLIVEPWNSKELDVVHDDVQTLGEVWRVKYFWKGFEKMLRDRRKPTNRIYRDHNLKDEIATKYRAQVEKWHRKMKPKSRELKQCPDNTVQLMLSGIRDSMDQPSADSGLKGRAADALLHATGQIQIATLTFLQELFACLRENVLHFTTEEDIECPVAAEMAPVYSLAQAIQQGTGAYQRTRAKVPSLILPEKEYPYRQPGTLLLENNRNQIVERQKALWKTHCTTYTTSVIASLDLFSRTSEHLLKNASYQTEKHEKARAELRQVLTQFKIQLKNLQSHFEDTQDEHIDKRVKREPSEDGDGLGATRDDSPAFDPQTAMVSQSSQPLHRQRNIWERWF